MSPARRLVDLTYKAARRVVVAVVGGTLVLVGVVLVFTPGPALVVIPLGLAVLAIEFTWARHLLRQLRSAAAGRSGPASGSDPPGGAPEAPDEPDEPGREPPPGRRP